jgi:WxcM-like, C-terminal
MNDFKSSLTDCKFIQLPKIHSPSGNLTSLEGGIDIPFFAKRVYYLYDVPGGSERGGHAHKELNQLVVAASGSFEVLLDDGINKKLVYLNRPNYGLLIVPGIWRELINFSSGAICLVLASTEYSESDYIRDFEQFKKLRNE